MTAPHSGRILAAVGAIAKMVPDEKRAFLAICREIDLLSPTYTRTRDESQLVVDRVGPPREYSKKKFKEHQQASISKKKRKARMPATPSMSEELFYKCFYEVLSPIGVLGIPYLSKNGKTYFTKNSRLAYASVMDNIGHIELLDPATIYKELAVWAYQRGALISAAKGTAAATLPDIFSVLIYDRGFITEVVGKYNNEPVFETGEKAQSQLRNLLDDKGPDTQRAAPTKSTRPARRSRLPRSLEHPPGVGRQKQYA